VPERSRLVADASPGGHGSHGPAVLGFGQDRLVPPGSLVAAALLDYKPHVEAAAPPDVLNRVAGPCAAVGDTLTIEQVGDFDQRAPSQLAPHSADDRCLLGHDLKLAGTDEPARGVPQTAVANRVMAAMPTILEESTLHPGHPFRVQVALH
jgi:hypothetical protein